jgi:hypothetical protein
MYTVKVLAAIVGTVAVAAAPPTPPPRVAGAPATPPPAWANVARTSLWLAYGSYCWSEAGKAACVDMIPPARRADVPRMQARRGQTIVVHLRFRASSITVTSGGQRMARGAGNTISWRAGRAGLVLVDVKARGDSASYVVRLRVR